MRSCSGPSEDAGLNRDFVRLSRLRLNAHYRRKLLACLGAMTDEGLQRATEGSPNSVEGIVSHILEHLLLFLEPQSEAAARIAAGQGGIEDCFPAPGASVQQLIGRVDDVFDRLDLLLADAESSTSPAPSPCLKVRKLFHLMEHLSYHLGQIVLLTQGLTGRRFNFVQNGLNEAQLNRILDGETQEE